MRYEFPIRASRPYVCSPDAAPAWREAYEAGNDMAKIEDDLKPTPEERRFKHFRKMAEHLKREEFLTSLQRGWDLVQTHHVHTR
jgi:hypothetical protein